MSNSRYERSYEELSTLLGLSERLQYLELKDFGGGIRRDLARRLYDSPSWRHLRRAILFRDGRFDLGVFGVYIDGPAYVHHINPLTNDDILHDSPLIYDPSNLITVSHDTHTQIHYGVRDKEIYVDRRPGDTILW